MDKNEEEITNTISYKLKFIDSATFMASSLSNLVNSVAEAIYKMKWKYGQDDKNWENCRIKYKGCNWFLEYTILKDELIE